MSSTSQRALPHALPHLRAADVRDPGSPLRDEMGSLAATVRARLRPVCAGWPPDQFTALVTDVVRFHERWAAP